MIDTLYIKITENCNLHCPFCYVDNKNNLIDTDVAIRAIEKYNPDTIVFHGGEPMLYPEKILDILDKYPDKNFSITSNLTLPLNDPRLSILKKCSVATSYSIDRFTDKITEKHFKENLHAVNMFSDVTLLVTLSKTQMQSSAKELVENIKCLHCKYVLFERLYTEDPDTNLSLMTDNYLNELMLLLPGPENVLKQMMINAINNNSVVFNLNCDKTVVTLNPDGTIQSCPNLITHKRTRRKECLTCDIYEYCREDCISFKKICMFPRKTFLRIKEDLYGNANK